MSPSKARALWTVASGQLEIREEPLAQPSATQVRVETHASAVSRGTERLVLQGDIPQPEYERMRAPHQSGDFPFPVKYGYSAAGIVSAGEAALVGRPVFALFPHQDAFNLDARAVVPIPDWVPMERATLAANMETALNGLWDSGAGPADNIVVVGGGIVGLLIAYLAAQLPGVAVTLIDVEPARAALASTLGAGFALPEAAPLGADVVFHASATQAGLATALACCGLEARLIEMSWYGAKSPVVELGGAFHSQRLQLISSQVGHVSPSRRPRWTHRRRLEAALVLLADDRLNALLGQRLRFEDAPHALPALLLETASGLAPILRYR